MIASGRQRACIECDQSTGSSSGLTRVRLVSHVLIMEPYMHSSIPTRPSLLAHCRSWRRKLRISMQLLARLISLKLGGRQTRYPMASQNNRQSAPVPIPLQAMTIDEGAAGCSCAGRERGRAN